jgi:multiple sugar transport system substrate-binding protein
MLRLVRILLFASLLFSACTPEIFPLNRELDATPTSTSTPRPRSATSTPAPTPVRPPDLGVSTQALRGLTVTVWHGWDGKSAALFTQMATEFSLTNTWGIQVTSVSQKNLSLLAQAVDSAFKTPEHPDIVIALPEQTLAWDAQNRITDLTPYVSHPDFGFSESEVNDIPAAFWKQSDVAGKRLGVPASRTARFLFYNVTFAQELGFTAPPQTADEFRAQACAATQSWRLDADPANDGYGGWVLDNPVTDNDAPWTAYSWLKAFKGDVYADGKYDFDTPENRSALEFLAKLRTDGCAWLSTAASNYEPLTNRKALFAAGSLNELPAQQLAFAGSSDQWTVIPFPGTERAILTYGPDYVVLKSNEARQFAAWLFVRWMLSPENQARWTHETGLFPVRSSAKELLKDILSVNPQWAAAADLIPQARAYPQVASWRKARPVLGDGFFALFQPNNPTAEQADETLQEIQSTVEEVVK